MIRCISPQIKKRHVRVGSLSITLTCHREWTENTSDKIEYEFTRQLQKMCKEANKINEKREEILQWYHSIKYEAFEIALTNVLHSAAEKNDHDIIKEISKIDCDLNFLNTEGKSILLTAIINNNEKIVNLLLKHEDTIIDNRYFDSCRGPLHYAINNLNPDIVELLINLGADVNAYDTDRITPMHELLRHHTDSSQMKNADKLRMKSRFKKIFSELLKSGANVNQEISKFGSLLHLALRNHADYTVPALLDAGAQINAVDENSRTPLHIAVQTQNVEAVECLIAYNANINAHDGQGATPLRYAVKAHNYTLTKKLLDLGASTDLLLNDEFDPIFEAVKSGNFEFLCLLVDALPDFRTPNDFKCLQVAIDKMDWDILAKMQDMGVDFSARDSRGIGIIYYFFYSPCNLELDRKVEVIKFFFKNVAGVDLKSIEMKNAFNILIRLETEKFIRSSAEAHALPASYHQFDFVYLLETAMIWNLHPKVFKLIIDKCRTVIDTARFINIASMLTYHAIVHDKLSILKYLLKIGVNIDFARQDDNYTALHLAAEHDSADGIRLLLLFGSDVNRENKRENTALKLSQVRKDSFNYKPDSAFYIIRRIALLKTFGKSIKEEDLELINSQNYLKTYYAGCMGELHLMQKNESHGMIRLLNPLANVKSYYRNSALVSNLSVTEGFDKYPLYKDILAHNMKVGRKSSEYLEKATRTIKLLLKWDPKKLYQTVLDNIFQYLSYKDLCTLASMSDNVGKLC